MNKKEYGWSLTSSSYTSTNVSLIFYRFYAPPGNLSVSPSLGPLGGATLLQVTGSGLAGGGRGGAARRGESAGGGGAGGGGGGGGEGGRTIERDRTIERVVRPRDVRVVGIRRRRGFFVVRQQANERVRKKRQGRTVVLLLGPISRGGASTGMAEKSWPLCTWRTRCTREPIEPGVQGNL